MGSSLRRTRSLDMRVRGILWRVHTIQRRSTSASENTEASARSTRSQLAPSVQVTATTAPNVHAATACMSACTVNATAERWIWTPAERARPNCPDACHTPPGMYFAIVRALPPRLTSSTIAAEQRPPTRAASPTPITHNLRPRRVATPRAERLILATPRRARARRTRSLTTTGHASSNERAAP